MSEYKRDTEKLEQVTRKDFDGNHSKYWHLKEYYKDFNQVCNTKKHFLRNKNTITSQIHCSLRIFRILRDKPSKKNIETPVFICNGIYRGTNETNTI